MLGIQIDNEFLDLLPATKLDMEINNPFLQFDNQLTGDYSLPVELAATPKNMRLLKFAGLIQTKVDRAGLQAAVYDGQNQHSVGRLKIEQPKINLLSANRARISAYYLTGSAGFFQEIKDLNLRAVDFGGSRSFPWDNYTPSLSGTGFWSHIHQVLLGPVGGFDYAFFPVENRQWTGESWSQVQSVHMNLILYGDNHISLAPSGPQPRFSPVSTDGNELNPIVPFPYLKYVMGKVAEHVGWKFEGAILDDPDFQKIVMVNFQSIDWGYNTQQMAFDWLTHGQVSHPGVHPAVVEFDLADNMPDMTVSDFLLALKNRFGWWYDFDNRNKTIKIQELQNVVSATVKDFTSKASPLITKKVSQADKIFSLKNEFVGEYANGQPSLANLYYQGSLNHKSDLPAGDVSLNGQVYLIREDNNYWICRPTSANPDLYTWQFYAYNVYDVVPDGATDDITTKATTLGVDYSDGSDGNSWFPRMDNPGNWGSLSGAESTWGIHLVFNHGILPNKIGRQYPYASGHPYDINGNQLTQWSLAFKCQLFDGTEVGLYDRMWKHVLDSVQQAETFEFSLYLERAEYLQLTFSDTIVINGVKMYLTKLKPTIPFTTKDGEAGELAVEALRI